MRPFIHFPRTRWAWNSLGRVRGFLPRLIEAMDEIRQERDI